MAQVTGLAVSDRHPYMFSCSLDKEVKCWDMEYNKVLCGQQNKSLLLPRVRVGWHDYALDSGVRCRILRRH